MISDNSHQLRFLVKTVDERYTGECGKLIEAWHGKYSSAELCAGCHKQSWHEAPVAQAVLSSASRINELLSDVARATASLNSAREISAPVSLPPTRCPHPVALFRQAYDGHSTDLDVLVPSFFDTPYTASVPSLSEMVKVGDTYLAGNPFVHRIDQRNLRIWIFHDPLRPLIARFALALNADCLFSVHSLNSPDPYSPRTTGNVFQSTALTQMLDQLRDGGCQGVVDHDQRLFSWCKKESIKPETRCLDFASATLVRSTKCQVIAAISRKDGRRVCNSCCNLEKLVQSKSDSESASTKFNRVLEKHLDSRGAKQADAIKKPIGEFQTNEMTQAYFRNALAELGPCYLVKLFVDMLDSATRRKKSLNKAKGMRWQAISHRFALSIWTRSPGTTLSRSSSGQLRF